MKKQDEKIICRGLAVLIMAFCFCLGSIMAAEVATALERGSAGEDGIDDQESSFANPAQAQHAANLAQEAASEPDEATLEALAEVEAAEAALEAAIEAGIEQEIAEAEANLAAAQEAYAAAVEAHTGVLTGEITDMRAAGMGWGEIAHELGVHPGVLGLGHTKEKQNKHALADEMEEATARNARSGWSKGHGVGLDAGVGEPGTAHAGLALGKSKGKTTAGVSGAAGLSGKGNSGNGGGKGGGNGGGVGNSGGKGKAGSDGSPGNSGGGKGSGDSGNGAEGGGKGGKGKGGGNGGGKGGK